MTILAVLADPILPVFAIMVIGFLLGRAGRVTVEEARVVNRLAMTVFLPVFIFGVMARAPLDAFRPVPMVAYALSEAAVFALGFWLARRVFARPAGEAVLLAFCGMFSNIAFYVLPIGLLLYDGAVVDLLTIVTWDSIIVFAGVIVALQLIDLGRVSPGRVVRTLVGVPVLQGIGAGFAVAALGLDLPAPLATFIDFTGGAAAPLALFALGVVLSQTPFMADRLVTAFTALKVALFPAAVALALWLLLPPGADTGLFLLGAAGPAPAMAFSLALLYGIRTEAIAPVIIWTSLLTLPVLAWLA